MKCPSKRAPAARNSSSTWSCVSIKVTVPWSDAGFDYIKTRLYPFVFTYLYSHYRMRVVETYRRFVLFTGIAVFVSQNLWRERPWKSTVFGQVHSQFD